MQVVQRRSIRARLATSALARWSMRFRMRDGSRIRSRVVDSGGLLSVHVDHDYDTDEIDWPATRTVVDIGAHVGSFTVWAARRAPAAVILAVEPNPETFRLLIENIRLNHLTGRVSAINAAIAAFSGSVHLESVEHSLGTRIALEGQGNVDARAETLEGLLTEGQLEAIDLLKIDCEGTEFSVFGSLSANTLGRIKALVCEYHPVHGHDVRELDTILRKAGFRVRRPNSPLGVLWATR